MTKKKITFEVLTDNFVNEHNKIDKEYLNNDLILTIENDSKYFNLVLNGKTKIQNIVWSGFLMLANYCLEYYDYSEYKVTSQHLKDWLKEYGEDYDILTPTIEYFKDMRKENLLYSQQHYENS